MEADFLEIRRISKTYGVVQALKDVSFSVKKGEVHTLLGENGAGKSTLIKIICGEETPTSGQIVVDSIPIKVFNPRVAINMGIAMVHQELAIFENMTVAENIFPSFEFVTRTGFLNKKKLYSAAAEKIKLFNMDLEASQKMDSLTLAQQQMVEILRCISAGQQIILLDEPTSGLNNEEVARLMQIIKQLKKNGITVIYISHRINEVMNISDRITVLRDGQYIGTYENNELLTETDLINRMVGRELTHVLYAAKTDSESIGSEVVFEVKGLTKRKSVQNVSFQLRKGEVLGFFGLEGSGTAAVSRMIFGLEAADSGEIWLNGSKMRRIAPDIMVENRIMYLNNNRKNAGLLFESSALDNMSMPVLEELSNGFFVNSGKLVKHTERYIYDFNIVIRSIYQCPKSLSGGNQQKLMFSICLGKKPQCMIINEPTRGVDVGAKSEIHKVILNLVKKGLSFIVFSSELPELIGIADRIIVMKENRISGEIFREDITEEAVMAAAAGTKS